MEAFRVDRHTFLPARVPKAWDTLTNTEARGIVWLFEAPKPTETYVIACDPAQGITGWDRSAPQDDEGNDNTAISVWRIGSREEKRVDDAGKVKIVTIPTDFQVAEYAAPVDFEAAAHMINALGRLYRGNGRMGVAHCIIEVYPGPGWMVEKTLISKYGYMNFYQPKYIDTMIPQTGKGIGWTATRESVRNLWISGSRHLNTGSVVIRSPWLLDEMKTTDPIRFMSYTSEAQSGFHDDRLRSMMLATWAAHDFSSIIRPQVKTRVERGEKTPSWQASAVTSDNMWDAWEKRFKEIAEG